MIKTIKIGDKIIGPQYPTFFIADIAANHDGDLERGKKLIYLAARAGADAAKFQHFAAESIVSDYGFKTLGANKSHQRKWGKSVFDVYRDASLDPQWTPILKETCDNAGIKFLTSPYSFEHVDNVDQYVSAYKVGSGDITWKEIIEYMAEKRKPIILATGASSADEVFRAVSCILPRTPDLALLQCNTNYTAERENFKHIQLNVLKTYADMFPDLILGLSDHTPGHATVLGAVALGARIVEKHFTDDTSRSGPDHNFSMDFESWQDMVERTRELEDALGTGIKKVEDNEGDTVMLQRRSIRLKKDMLPGDQILMSCIEMLRPCPADAISPWEKEKILGKTITRKACKGDYIKWNMVT